MRLTEKLWLSGGGGSLLQLSSLYSYGAVTAGVTSFTSGNFTTPNNSLVAVIVYAQRGGTPVGLDTATISDSGSHTWTLRNYITAGTSPYVETAIWTAPVTVGSSIAISLSGFANAVLLNMDVVGFTGYNVASPIGATATGNNASNAPSITLSGLPSTRSMVLAAECCYPVHAGDPSIPGTGFTQLYNEVSGSLCTQSQYETSPSSLTVAWTNIMNGDTVGSGAATQVALEIKSA